MKATRPGTHPVYAIVGHDRFLRSEALAELMRALEEDADDLGPVRFEGSRAGLADVLDEVRTVSLLGSRRIVIVDEADAFITAHRPSLERYCGAPSDGGVLILACQTFPRTTRLCKAIAKHGAVLRCDAPKGRALTDWIMRRAEQRYEKRLGMPAAQKLREHVGDSLGAVDAELSKLAAYVGARTAITTDDIEALTGHHREEKVFAVMDAIASKDPAGALRCWEQVLATDRAAPIRAIAGLAWGLRRLLEARRDLDRGVSIRALAPRMYTRPDLLQRRLERVTTAQLEAQQRDLLAADLAVKTGASTVECAVEKFIVKHSVAASGTEQDHEGTDR
jgi:DNA polymerase-3 subunit delta